MLTSGPSNFNPGWMDCKITGLRDFGISFVFSFIFWWMFRILWDRGFCCNYWLVLVCYQSSSLVTEKLFEAPGMRAPQAALPRKLAAVEADEFLPTCHEGHHDHLQNMMSMHFGRFSPFVKCFAFFLCEFNFQASKIKLTGSVGHRCWPYIWLPLIASSTARRTE